MARLPELDRANRSSASGTARTATSNGAVPRDRIDLVEVADPVRLQEQDLVADVDDHGGCKERPGRRAGASTKAGQQAVTPAPTFSATKPTR